MKIFEFTSTDALSDLRRLHNRPNKKNAIENINNHKNYIQNFIDVATNDSLTEDQLETNNLYLPFECSFSLVDLKITILAVNEPVIFLGYEGSRLKFRNATGKFIHFPTNAVLGEEEYQFFYTEKDQLLQLVTILLLKFKNSEWDLTGWGYDQNANIQRIANI